MLPAIPFDDIIYRLFRNTQFFTKVFLPFSFSNSLSNTQHDFFRQFSGDIPFTIGKWNH